MRTTVLSRLAPLVTMLCILSSTLIYAQPESQPRGARVLRNLHGRVEGAYLASSELYRYLIDVNLWLDYGQWKDAVLFFNGGLLTYVSTEGDESFQPERMRGTIEPGAYIRNRNNIYYFYIKHQSFHDIDDYDGLDESYEIYTLAYKYSGVPNVFLSVGKFSNTQDVDYDWEYVAWVEFSCIGRCYNKPIYLSGSVRRVTEDDNPTGRDGFTDYTAELGLQTTPGLRYYTAYRKIHDVNQFNGVTDEQWLLGLKYLW